MIDFYTFATPNGQKPAILLEELEMPYTANSVHIGKNEQFSPEFVAINPNSKIPAIVDRDTDTTVFESGAILIYLAEKAGKFLPTSGRDRYQVLEWLMFQMGGVGPMFGQFGHFRNYASEKVPYGIARYEKETLRLLKVLDGQLGDRPYIAGDYSIADMATYPWITAAEPYLGLSLEDFPNIQRWVETLQQRNAVKTGMAVLTPEFDSVYGTVATS
ncbi:MAG: glutathione S-transferase N-terminal domain-containing protein [Cyanobacteria bacterium P01_D01_bin.73]